MTKLFAYQNAYDEAFARLYPNLLTVDLLGASSTPQSSPITAPNRMAVFVSIDCKGFIERIQHLQDAGHTRSLDDSLPAELLEDDIEPTHPETPSP